MSSYLIGLVMFIYLWVAYTYWHGPKRIGMTLAFIGYAIANIGLIIDVYEVSGDN